MAASESDPRNDAHYLELSRRILGGQAFESRDLGAAKVLGFVLAAEGADTLITSSIIKLRFAGGGSVHRYFLDCAPAVVWDLMGRLHVDKITGSVVGRLAHDGARLPGIGAPASRPDMVGWIVPDDRGIAIHTRPSGGEFPPTGPIPANGRWSLPERTQSWESLPWAPQPHKILSLAEPLACPHCLTPSTTFRQLARAALVCPSCAQSFEHTGDREPDVR
jgi:hypothetical protein